MGTEMPKTGERPFKIDKNAKGSNNHSQIQGKSVLNEQRLREHVSTIVAIIANLTFDLM